MKSPFKKIFIVQCIFPVIKAYIFKQNQRVEYNGKNNNKPGKNSQKEHP